MKYTNLSTTDISVSKTCLWTMSFWAHVSEKKSFEIMDKALDLWINFIDTAEIYSVPPSKDTYWVTENIIWKWLKDNNRNNIILASKVSWPSSHISYIRWWNSHFDEKNIIEAIEWSLKRLWTDYIDLYQLHWPDRNVNVFGQRDYLHFKDEHITPIYETLKVLKKLRDKWYVREFWLSNESPWGTMQFLQIAKENNLPRMVSVQNNYSLLTRSYDNWMSEVGLREDIWLLSYSSLWFWVLWWRYLDWKIPSWWRFEKYPNYAMRYRSKEVEKIIKKYDLIAKENNLTLAELSLAFVYSRDFLTSCIIWPSNTDQLAENARAVNIQLSASTIRSINSIHDQYPNPCP